MQSPNDVATRWPALDISTRRARVQQSLRLAPRPLADVFTVCTPAAERAAGALWLREPSAWSSDAAVQQKIANRLGWMSSPYTMADALDRLTSFGASIRAHGFTDVVLLGMGGSSLAPEVLRAIVGVAPGWPAFHMLDSTDPDTVRAASTPPETTLYVVASKSGTTIEPNSLAEHFRQRLEDAGVRRWFDHFVAITDEDTELARRARTDRFRDLFINPGDIGGRYSALSFFGLVPAALMGQDVASLVGWGIAMLTAAEPGFGTAAANPATGLGLAIGAAARAGRDKLTLTTPPSLAPFGLWVEQLIAESTGKNGSGVIPIVGEEGVDLSAENADRLFVRINARDSADSTAPTADIDLPEPLAIGAEFVRWEIATAVAGALLHVNPFDEPNVQQAKDATNRLLDRYVTSHALPAASVEQTLENGVTLSSTEAARRYLGDRSPDGILSLLRKGDYFAVLAYLGPDPELAAALQAFRRSVGDSTHVATMFGYGPRYLHSTGQLHKGGPNTGVFVLITAAPTGDLPIPGRPFSFGTLELAQALGDFASLDATGRRALHAHLPSRDPALIREVNDALVRHIQQ